MTGFYIFYVVLTKGDVIRTINTKGAIRILLGVLLCWFIDMACVTIVLQEIIEKLK